MTIAEVAHAVSGELVDCPEPDTQVTGAAADSRLVQPGDIYVAIVGERVDGHDFAASAGQRGAVVTLASRPTGTPAILVPDPVAALGTLAHHVRDCLPDATVVAVTGSSGKTTTKDLIAGLLADLGPTVAPAGSLNTEVGLPLTVLQADLDTKYFVLEMGSRGLGHVSELCRIVKPDISVVLNVGTAHLGEFGDRATIAAAKSEIVAALAGEDLAVRHADDPAVSAMDKATRARVIKFGTSANAEVRATGLELDAMARPVFTLELPDGVGGRAAVRVVMSMHGEHMVSNAAAAAAVAQAAGMPPDRIAELLSAAVPRSQMRMDVRVSPAGVTIVNDAYNANPDSMRAALRSLAAMSGPGRTFAVLGEMKELGSASIEEHDAVGRLAVRLDISKVIAVGEGARPLHLGAAQEGSWSEESVWVPDAQGALAVLEREVRPGDVVLVKASRSVGLEVVAEGLLNMSAGPAEVPSSGTAGEEPTHP